MFIGEFSPSLFFKICSYTIAGTLPLIYLISQWYGHEKPFPDCWISGCAGHYPEFIFFRIATISGSVLVILGWLTNHFYLKSISREAAFRIETYHPEIPLLMGMIGGMLLMGSTANIDTGKRNGKWHTFCASRFFIFTLLALIYNTVLYYIVHSKIGKVSTSNLYFKIALAAAMVLQLYVSLEYGEFDAETWEGLGSVNVILEWTLTLTVIANFYLMGLDVEHFKFVYEEVKESRAIKSEKGSREGQIHEVD